MKSGKIVAPVEIWRYLRDMSVTWLIDLFNQILQTKKIPNESKMSTLISLYMNKDDIQNCFNQCLK